jgi:hypothetical protein
MVYANVCFRQVLRPPRRAAASLFSAHFVDQRSQSRASDLSGTEASLRSATPTSLNVSPNATCDFAAETTARAIHFR